MNKELFMFFIRKVTNYRPASYSEDWEGWSDYDREASVEFHGDGLVKMEFKDFAPEFSLVEKAIHKICNGKLRADFFKNKSSETIKNKVTSNIKYKRHLYTEVELNIYKYPLTFNICNFNIEISGGTNIKRKGLIEGINQHINEYYKKELQEFLKKQFKEYYLDYIDDKFSKKERY